jgi:tRNA(Arg) A34 adenosine deaminase TadA
VEKQLLSLNLPDWLEKYLAEIKPSYPTLEERMQFVIELSRFNVKSGTGGPFGAAVFGMDDGRLLSAGVNLVLASSCSVLHAEITALIIAQQKLDTFDLGATGSGRYELVTSTEPCVMCLGAVQWAGVRRLVCGARGEDAEGIGFDEGEKPANWKEALERRAISVVRDVCRNEAVAVLREYIEGGGVIYNSRR